MLLLRSRPSGEIQGAKGEAVVTYCEPLAMRLRFTRLWRAHRLRRCGILGLSASGGLSHRVNNMAVFTICRMTLGVNSIKAEKKIGNTGYYSL